MTVVRNFRQTCLSRVVYLLRHTFGADMVGQLSQRSSRHTNALSLCPSETPFGRLTGSGNTPADALDNASLRAVRVAFFNPFGLPEGRDDPMLTCKLT
jgi:hypothetical protein